MRGRLFWRLGEGQSILICLWWRNEFCLWILLTPPQHNAAVYVGPSERGLTLQWSRDTERKDGKKERQKERERDFESYFE